MDGKWPSTADDVIKIMNSAQYRVKEHNVAKGMQLEYTLMPLATIEKLFLKEENPGDRVVQSIDNAIIDDCEYKMGVLLLTKQRFNDLYQRVKENAYFLNEQLLVDFNTLQNKTKTDEKSFLKNLRQVLVQVGFIFQRFHLINNKIINK